MSLLLLLKKRNKPSLRGLITGFDPSAISFSRASVGTRFNAAKLLVSEAIDAPRFAYDPVTGRYLGLLVEPQRTNSAYPSTPDATWGGNNVVKIFGAGTAPDGSNTLVKLQDNSTLGLHNISGVVLSFTSGVTYTQSWFLKKDEHRWCQITMPAAPFGTSQYANFDLEAGVVGNYSGLTPAIQNCGGGVYRCSISMAATASTGGGANVVLTNNLNATSRLPSYSGSGGGVYIWGAQIELGGYASSTIITSGAAVTRATEALSFTIPSGVSALRYTFDDDSTQDVSVSSGAYTVPTNLNRSTIKRIQNV